MTMEADFYQGPDGKDERGNDIIYEFNGDDDMWLYIDNRLVLDIGGCHGAVSGTINFSTGEVRVNGSQNQVHTTLKQIFQNAGKLPDGSNWREILLRIIRSTPSRCSIWREGLMLQT